MHRIFVRYLGALVAGGVVGCSSTSVHNGAEDDFGQATVAIKNAPADATCIQLVVTESSRAVERDFDVTAGQDVKLSIDLANGR